MSGSLPSPATSLSAFNGAAVGLLVAFLTLAGCQCHGRPMIVTVLLLAWPVVFAVVVLRRLTWLAAAYLLVVGVLLRLGTLVGFFGVPPAGVASDVLTITREALAVLMQRQNPYTHAFTTGQVPIEVYAYGPGSLLYYLPGFLLGNVRYMEIVAAGIVLAGLAWTARILRTSWPLALMGLYAAAPPLVTLATDNSNDTGVGALLFAATLALLLARRHTSTRGLVLAGILLGWAVAFKHYTLAFWPFFVAYLYGQGWTAEVRIGSWFRRLASWVVYAVSSIGFAALLSLPFVIWSPVGFARSLAGGSAYGQSQATGGWNVWTVLATWAGWDAGAIYGVGLTAAGALAMVLVIAVGLRIGVRRPAHALLGGALAWFAVMFLARWTTYAYFAGVAPLLLLVPISDGLAEQARDGPDAPLLGTLRTKFAAASLRMWRAALGFLRAGVRRARDFASAHPWVAAAGFGGLVALVYHVSIPGSTPYNQYQLLAESLLRGRLDLVDPPIHLETVHFAGRQYITPPPLPALLLVPVVALFPGREVQGAFAAVAGGAGAALALLIAGRIMRQKADRWWLAVLWAFGTILWHLAAVASLWYVAHVVAALALNAAMLEALGRRRPLIIGAAVAAAFWTRLPAVMALPFFVVMTADLWAPRGLRDIKNLRLGYLNALTVPVAAAVLLNFAYNWLRFGTIADVAYRIGMDLKSGLFVHGPFHPSYIARHLGPLLYALPRMLPEFPYVTWSFTGLAIWVTTPAFFLALLAPFRERSTWAAWISIALGLLSVMNFGNTGMTQFGYRFAADFYPLLFFLTLKGAGGRLRLGHKVLIALSVVACLWGVVWERLGWSVL